MPCFIRGKWEILSSDSLIPLHKRLFQTRAEYPFSWLLPDEIWKKRLAGADAGSRGLFEFPCSFSVQAQGRSDLAPFGEYSMHDQQQPFLVLSFSLAYEFLSSSWIFTIPEVKKKRNKLKQLKLYYFVEPLLLIRNWSPASCSSSVEICQVNRNHLVKALKQLWFIF